ncbi:MAG: 6-carboxytetrahydropterin synthase, partial [Candidatus Omnitrophota bacterium]|nr:6-carboxytetrahydropterin synthase [Candidatus Omnitrophota bacterium]
VIDFRKIKQKLNRILVKLDHGYLNEIPYFKKCNTTSEHIARYIYLELTGLIKKKGLRVKEVIVWETDTSSATYRPNNLTI